jgi:hypothetical protein
MAVSALDDEVHRVVSAAVDGAFYRSAYRELDRPGFDPVRHYLTQGWREGRDPAPWFSVRAYLTLNPDIADAGLEPLHHYLTQGRREGREVSPSDQAEVYLADRARRGEPAVWSFEPRLPAARAPVAEGPRAPEPVTEADRRLARSEFDPAFYLTSNPDIAEAGADPLEHFLTTGWLEGRDPNARFSVRDYLETYPDIVQAGVNPFVHYLRAGRAEGRAPRSQLGFRYHILAHQRPVAERVAAAQSQSADLEADAPARLAEAFAGSRTGLADLHLTFSHDDYTASLGGLQLCIRREAARIEALGRDHLHLFPARHWPILRTDEGSPLGVVLNDRLVGVFKAAAVAKALAGAAKPGDRSLAIHSLLGHSVSEVAAIARAAGVGSGFFWLHDFASLCAGYHLMRNDVQDCAAPPPDSAACGICAYQPWRARHLAEHERLFREIALTVVSPSQPTLDLWRASWRFAEAGQVVLPHARLVERGLAPRPAAGPLRVAFLGFPAPHKGWPVFRDLSLRFAEDPRYSFVHLGDRPTADSAADFHAVSVTGLDGSAMQQAAEALEVDVALIWPLCRETFSFTAYEAIAAGAALLTNPDSGNVCAVAQDGHGLVLPDEAALFSAFEDGRVLDLARARRAPMLYDLAFSGMTADLLASS